MARIKIERSRSKVQDPAKFNLAPLVLSQNLALQVSNAYSQLGNAIAKTAEKTKKTEDKNTLRYLKIKSLPIIQEAKDKYKFSTDINDAQLFLEDMLVGNFENLLRSRNQEVKNAFQLYLLSTVQTEFGELYTNILTRHAQKSEDTLLETITEFDAQEAESNPQRRNNAQKEKSLIWTDATNIANLGEAKIKQLKKDSELRTKKFQYSYGTDNDPVSILAIGKEIRKEVGDIHANYILQNAENKIISDAIQEDRVSEIEIKADQEQKISNYAHVIKKIRLNDPSVSLDDINDLYKADQINSAQRNSLYKIYAGEIELSDDNVINLINGAMAIAGSVEDIDLLQRTVLLSPDVVDRLNVGHQEDFIGIFEKYKDKLPAFKEFQKNRKLLEDDLGVLNMSGDIIIMAGASNKKKVDKRLVINSLAYYDKLILEGANPDDAYLQTINEKLNNDNFPSIYELTDVISIDLKPPIKTELENGKVYFENRRAEVLEVYNKTGDIKTFAEDISKLDSIEILFNLRKDFYKDEVDGGLKKAFSGINETKIKLLQAEK